MSDITSHRNAHNSTANMHEAKGFPSALNGYSYRKNIQGVSEWKRDFRRPNALNLINGYEAPATEVDGDVYAISSPELDINAIVWQNGTTVRFTFTSGFDDTLYSVNSFLQISGETGEIVHNGVWVITAVVTTYLEVTNASVTDGANDVASSSPATGYVTHEDYDPENLSNGQTIPMNGLVRYYGTPDLWWGDLFQNGDEYYNEATQSMDLFNGSDVLSSPQLFSAKVSMTVADLLAATSVEIVPAPGAGKAIELISMAVDYTFVSAAYDTAVSIDCITDTASALQGATASILNVGSSVFVRATLVASAATGLVADKGLTVKSNTGSGAGDGTAEVYITYRKITL